MATQPDKINKDDKEILKCFFAKEATTLKIIEEWRSTNWINHQDSIKEWSNRTEKRLKKLKKLSLIQSREEIYASKPRPIWYPTTSGLYYMLTTQDSPYQLRNFIVANREVGHLDLVRKCIHRSGIKRITILVTDIQECVQKLKYKKIRRVIQEFFDEIEPHYIDWNIDIEPNARTKKYNHQTKKYEIF